MEGNKSFLMYILVFIFIAVIVIFFVLPKNGEVLLECSSSNKSQSVNTIYNIMFIVYIRRTLLWKNL